jgi:hypothetical protein
MRTILGLLVGTLLIAGCAGTTGSPAPASAPASAATAASPSPSGAFGGVAHFTMDGKPATTTVDLVVDGASVSGTAVTDIGDATDLGKGTHTVKLGCASQQGDWWAVGGKTDKTTVNGEKAGDWSAVIVRDGSPQLIGIWLSDDPSKVSDCSAWLAAIDFADMDLQTFDTVESGTLVHPTVPAS